MTHPYRRPVILVLIAGFAAAAFVWPAVASASHTQPGTKLWAYEAASPPTARILQYDIGTDTFDAACVPTPSGNGRAIAFDPADGNLWYAFVGPPSGFIHKTTPPPGCTPVTQIPFGDGPGGATQDDIGAMDLAPNGHIWAAGYLPFAGNRQILYEVNRNSGAILEACWVPTAPFGPGNDSLAVTQSIPGFPGGTYLVTDAGEFNTFDPLLVADAASATPYTTPAAVPPCEIVTTYDPPVGLTGIDFEDPPSDDLIGTDLRLIYDLGGPPFMTIQAVMSALPSQSLEDITLGLPRAAPAEPFSLVLTPEADVNEVGTQHCVTATVRDAAGQPVSGVSVVFDVEGASEADADPPDEDGEATTNAVGEAEFCYTGPDLPGTDAIHAFADTDEDGSQDAPPPAGNEPFDDATKAWALPPSTPGCDVKITLGARITAANGDRATAGGNADVDPDGTTRGQQSYQDHGPAQRLVFHSTTVLAVVCESTTQATIFGEGTVDGSGSFSYRIRVEDNGEPGVGVDRYGIVIGNGYASGDQLLEGGNVQIHD